MRTLLALDTVGGAFTYGLELAHALGARGVEVVLAALGEPLSAEQRRAALDSPAQRICAHECALEWMDDPWEDVARSGAWLLGVGRESDVDLVHLNGYAHAALPWPVPVVVGAHSDVLSWHTAVRGEAAGPEWDEYRARMAAGLRAADAVVTSSAAMLEALPLTRSCEALVIPNARAGFAPRDKEPFVLTAGNGNEAANVAALDRLAPWLPWPVVVAGDPGMGPARRLGHVSGPRLAELLGRAAIFAEPARYEPFGLAALAAGLSGCALVLGDIPSLREVWGDAAVFVDPDDDETLERVLLLLMADERRRRDLGGRARERALTYSPERFGDDYLELYECLLAAEPFEERVA